MVVLLLLYDPRLFVDHNSFVLMMLYSDIKIFDSLQKYKLLTAKDLTQLVCIYTF